MFGEPDTSTIENRNLAPLPDVAGKPWKWKVRTFPKLFDAWYSDHFGCRALLLEANALINFSVLSYEQRVAIGQDGWLFYKFDPPLFSLSLSQRELASWKSYLERRQRWLAARGIKYLFIVPPDKDSIYPEFLPTSVGHAPEELPVDQLIRYLRETSSTVPVLSLRDAVLAGKAREQSPLYYKQDGHWNTVGAYYGYDAVIGKLSGWFPTLHPRPRTDYRVATGPEKVRDIAHLAGLPDSSHTMGAELEPLFTDAAQQSTIPNANFRNPTIVTEMPGSPGSTLPRLVMLRDSFTISLMPFLSQNFSHATYFWITGVSIEQEKSIADTVLKEKPDIFIEERLERAMPAVPDEKLMFGGVNP